MAGYGRRRAIGVCGELCGGYQGQLAGLRPEWDQTLVGSGWQTEEGGSRVGCDQGAKREESARVVLKHVLGRTIKQFLVWSSANIVEATLSNPAPTL